jgi:uncharacterized protein YdaT
MSEKQQVIPEIHAFRVPCNLWPWFKAALLTITLLAITTAAQQEKFASIPSADGRALFATDETNFSFGDFRPFAITERDYYKTSDGAVHVRHSMCWIKNTGANASSFWWYYKQTPESLKAIIKKDNLRIISLFPYWFVPEPLAFAAILVPNTGSQAKAWWWYVNVSRASIKDRLAENHARLIDIHQSGLKGQYSVVMISNTGADQKVSWWDVGKSISEVKAEVAKHKGRLVRMAPEWTVLGDQGPWDYIMVAADEKESLWYYNKTKEEIGLLVTKNKARVIDLEMHNAPDGSTVAPRFSVIMLKE